MHSDQDLDHAANDRAPRRRRVFWGVRMVAALLLMIGAGSKLLRFVEISSGDGLLSDLWLLRLVIGGEAGLAVWIATAPASLSRWSIVGVFGSFACLVGYSIASGQHCNCIAEAIPAGVMLTLDITVCAAALLCGPQRPPRRASNTVLAAGAGLSVAVVLLIIAASRDPLPEIAEANETSLEFLLAENLVNHPWPLDSRSSAELEPLETGEWLVLVVRPDCGHCEELLSACFEDPKHHRPEERTALFAAGSSRWDFRFDHMSLHSPPAGQIHWPDGEPFVSVPAVFHLKNGLVTAAADGTAADELLWQLLFAETTTADSI